ncbi:MAG: response regulator [Armatimonadota bacterium]
MTVDLVGTERKDLAILLADDDEAIRDLVSQALRQRGFTDLTLARDGIEAIDAVRRYRYDMVLLDLRMPRVGGVEVFDTVVSMYGDDVVVLVATGHATVEQAVDLMRRGVYDYIVKPFRIRDVVAAVERAEQRCYHLRELADSMELIFTLVRLMESKDPYLRNHSARVRDYAVNMRAPWALAGATLSCSSTPHSCTTWAKPPSICASCTSPAH